MANHPHQEQYIHGRNPGRTTTMNTDTTTQTEANGIMDKIANRTLTRVWNCINPSKGVDGSRWGVNAYDLTLSAGEFDDLLSTVGGGFEPLGKTELEEKVTSTILNTLRNTICFSKLEGNRLKIHVEQLWSIRELQVALYLADKRDPEFFEKYKTWYKRQLDIEKSEMMARLGAEK